jgi:hypothetical protein
LDDIALLLAILTGRSLDTKKVFGVWTVTRKSTPPCPSGNGFIRVGRYDTASMAL